MKCIRARRRLFSLKIFLFLKPLKPKLSSKSKTSLPFFPLKSKTNRDPLKSEGDFDSKNTMRICLQIFAIGIQVEVTLSSRRSIRPHLFTLLFIRLTFMEAADLPSFSKNIHPRRHTSVNPHIWHCHRASIKRTPSQIRLLIGLLRSKNSRYDWPRLSFLVTLIFFSSFR